MFIYMFELYYNIKTPSCNTNSSFIAKTNDLNLNLDLIMMNNHTT